VGRGKGGEEEKEGAGGKEGREGWVGASPLCEILNTSLRQTDIHIHMYTIGLLTREKTACI